MPGNLALPAVARIDAVSLPHLWLRTPDGGAPRRASMPGALAGPAHPRRPARSYARPSGHWLSKGASAPGAARASCCWPGRLLRRLGAGPFRALPPPVPPRPRRSRPWSRRGSLAAVHGGLFLHHVPGVQRGGSLFSARVQEQNGIISHPSGCSPLRDLYVLRACRPALRVLEPAPKTKGLVIFLIRPSSAMKAEPGRIRIN